MYIHFFTDQSSITLHSDDMPSKKLSYAFLACSTVVQNQDERVLRVCRREIIQFVDYCAHHYKIK